jgi:hypothetical protein
MDAYDRCTNLGKINLADIVAIYGRGRELFESPTYLFQMRSSTSNFHLLIHKLIILKISTFKLIGK